MVLALQAACAPTAPGGSLAGGSADLRVEGEGPRPWFHDFGEVPFGEAREHTFRLTNVSSTALTLLDVQGGCTCSSVKRVVARLPDGRQVEGNPRAENGMLVVPPKALAELTLKLDTGRTQPNVRKLEVMRLRTDSDSAPFVTFELAVHPLQLFQVTPASIDLGEVPSSHGGDGKADIVTGRRGSPARLLRVEQQGASVRATLEEHESADESIWKLAVSLPPKQPLGVMRDRVVLASTDEAGQGDAGRLEVPVWARVVEDLVVSPSQISLGAAPSTEGFVAEASLRCTVPGGRVLLREAEVTGTSRSWIQVESTGLAPDARGRTQHWKLAIRLLPGHPEGRVDAGLRLHTDDPELPVIEAPLVGWVR